MGKFHISKRSGKLARPFESEVVAETFNAYPLRIRKRLMALRSLIFETADKTKGVGALEETLKWGEPAYLTSKGKSGSTVRIGWKKSIPSQYAMYFHCQTDLVETFRTLFPSDFRFEGNRAIVFEEGDAVPFDSLAICVSYALTYHRIKGRQRRPSQPSNAAEAVNYSVDSRH